MKLLKQVLDSYWKRIAAGAVVGIASVLLRDFLFLAGVAVGLGLIGWGLVTWDPPRRKGKPE